MPDEQKEQLWTPANIVTLVRLCCVPVFVVALLSPWPSWLPEGLNLEDWKSWIAIGIFILLAGTDGVDGYLARRRGEITNLGKFMDPLADKILVAAALLALIELDVLPSWVVLIILSREFIVSGIRMIAASQGVVIAASWLGKAKTVSQIAAIVLFLIKESHIPQTFLEMISAGLYVASWLVMLVALVLTVLSLLDYLMKSRDILGFSRKDSQAAAIVPSDIKLHDLARQTLALAHAKHKTLGTAESCTGGLLAATLTSVPGSSESVMGGVVSYANEVKIAELDVDPQTLQEDGAVSESTAIQMAEGARGSLGVDVAVSITGIAGPDGGSKEKPVGTVWFAVSSERGTQAQLKHYEGSREEIRKHAVEQALEMFAEELRVS